MSIKTWKAEFYPTKPTKRMSKKDAILHSLRKWEGLTKENLDKHGLDIICGNLYDENDDEFEINSDTCSLCVKYWHGEDECATCPLFKKLRFDCGDGRLGKDGFRKWIVYKNPDLMIKNLKSLLVDE